MSPEQIAFEDKWLNKIVRVRNTSDYKIPRTNYKVTAALLEYDGDANDTIFAIMSSEYSLPDKPWWYTMRFGKGDDLTTHLDKHFEIL